MQSKQAKTKNFSCSPHLFLQLYTFTVLYVNKCLICVYIYFSWRILETILCPLRNANILLLIFFTPIWSKAHVWQVRVKSVWCGNSNQWEWNSIKEQSSRSHTQSCDRNTSEPERFPSDGASADSYAAHTRFK